MEPKRSESGAIIIEATLILTMFMFMFMMFYDTVNICFKQVKVMNAMSAAAKEISEFSYIYALTNVDTKLNTLKSESDTTKSDIKTNVVDNVSGVIDAIEEVGNTGSDAVSEIKSTDFTSLEDLMSTADSLKSSGADIKENAETIKESATSVAEYLKKNLSKDNIKSFGVSLLKVLASDGAEYIKSALGSLLAETLTEQYFTTAKEQAFFNTISWDKSMLFPGSTQDIILVAEYKVQIAPFIPVKIERTISQQVITAGWFRGDASSVKKTEETEAEKTEYNETIWSDMSTTERAKYIRSRYLSENSELCKLSGNSYVTAYDPTSNKVIYVGSSNLLYGKEGLEYITDDEIKETYTNMVSNLKRNTPSVIEYKATNEKGDVERKSAATAQSSYELVLVVPEDSGLKEKMQAYWDSMPEEDKKGVTLKLETGYGSYIKEQTDASADTASGDNE